jgi:hypothetical protein
VCQALVLNVIESHIDRKSTGNAGRGGGRQWVQGGGDSGDVNSTLKTRRLPCRLHLSHAQQDGFHARGPFLYGGDDSLLLAKVDWTELMAT